MKYYLCALFCITSTALVAGPFGMTTVLPETTHGSSVVAGDRVITGLASAQLNSDARPDVLALSSAGDEIFWLDVHTGAVTTNLVSDGVEGPEAVLPMDVDNDGDMDLIVSSRWDRNLVSFINDGNGNFTSGGVLASQVDTVVSLATADLDNNGLDDIIGISDHDGELFWISQTSSGNFGSKQVIFSYSHAPQQVWAQDVTNDTVPELFVLTGGRVMIYENDGAANFTVTGRLGKGGVSAFQVADIDGGQADVITSSRVTGVLTFYSNDNTGGYGAGVVLSATQVGWDIVAVVDLDRDNHQDLLLSSHTANALKWYKGDGAGGLSMQSPDISVHAGPTVVALADYDGDQDTDLALAALTGEDLSLYQGLGSTPYTFWSFDYVTNPSSLSEDGDANGDGIDNLMHYATNTSPLESSSVIPYLAPTSGVAGLPVQIVETSTTGAFEFVRRTNTRPHGLTYTVQSSSNLLGWDPVTLNSENSTVTPIDADWERVRFNYSTPGSAPYFLRLRIHYSNP